MHTNTETQISMGVSIILFKHTEGEKEPLNSALAELCATKTFMTIFDWSKQNI